MEWQNVRRNSFLRISHGRGGSTEVRWRLMVEAALPRCAGAGKVYFVFFVFLSFVFQVSDGKVSFPVLFWVF